MHKAVQMTYAISVVTESIKNGVFVTKRFMYYHCKEVYDINKVANTMLDHICCIFGCIISSMNVFIEEMNSVMGSFRSEIERWTNFRLFS